MFKEKNLRFEEALETIKNANLSSEEVITLLGIGKVVLDRTDKKHSSLPRTIYDKPDYIAVDEKHCHVCGNIKKVSEFYKGQTRCKKCDAHYKKTRQSYRDHINKKNREKTKKRKQSDKDNETP